MIYVLGSPFLRPILGSLIRPAQVIRVIHCVYGPSEKRIKDGPLTKIERPVGDKFLGQE
jgi:hypothetical protein